MCSTDKTIMSSQRQRRINKPLMERKRRERINQCLNELKTLVLKAQKKDLSRFTKLEKADILEMTVRHIKSLHADKKTSLDDKEMARYRSGFAKCVSEVAVFMQGVEGLPHQLCSRIASHLNNIIVKLSGKEDDIQVPVKTSCQFEDQVPLASLENNQGFLTISRNVPHCKGRTVPVNTISIKNISARNTSFSEWCPTCPTSNEALHSRLQEHEKISTKISRSISQNSLTHFVHKSQSAYPTSSTTLHCTENNEKIILSVQQSSSIFQDAPLNLATTQRDPSAVDLQNTQRYNTYGSINSSSSSTPHSFGPNYNNHYVHSFPPSPPSSISSSPEPLPEHSHSPSTVRTAHSNKRPNLPGNYISTQLTSTVHWRPW